ncbi:MAG TPA: 5-(carboxyamino)imidazole ribonucleotide synthase [Allosphingosinicella sp.]|nr:5-(carboxyamino)imidazole ribonucleotide synthase [Allosphingosinicella sp.]
MTIPPGSTIGIVGGGQLGRMLALAAAQLGYRCHVYAPDADSVAAQAAAAFTRGAFDDEAALARFAAEIDVATYEFENIPTAPLRRLAGIVGVRPPLAALETAQDRLEEKSFVERHGGRPAPYARVDDRAGLDAALAAIGTPAILKTRRFGYDGKGQVRIDAPGEAARAWADVRGAPCVVEALVRFDAEFSILLCRGGDGETVIWDAPRNRHEGGLLVASSLPAGAELAGPIAAGAALARRVADALDYVGVMAMEFFAVGGDALFNEMAPRVHNSGHWTIEGALTSQFENHIRAICGLPLGATDRTAPRVEMANLVGAEADGWAEILADPAAHLHLYGKADARPGRKMGHVTRLLT